MNRWVNDMVRERSSSEESTQVETTLRAIVDNFDFALEGTRCKAIFTGNLQHFEDGLQQVFPDDQLRVRSSGSQDTVTPP